MTPERKQKFISVLNKRQSGLTVVLENVHDPHNISAVLRSCDAVGIHEVFVVNTITPRVDHYGMKSSSSALKWVAIHFFDDVNECIIAVRKKYDFLFSTRLGEHSKSIYELGLTQSVALLFGNEKDGLSEEISKLVDGNFMIPQVGMIHSLNISVACAVTLYEAFRQRNLKKMYDAPTLAEREYNSILDYWVERHENPHG